MKQLQTADICSKLYIVLTVFYSFWGLLFCCSIEATSTTRERFRQMVPIMNEFLINGNNTCSKHPTLKHPPK